MTDDIHNRGGRIKNTIETIHNLENISDNNKKIILGFKDYLYCEDLSLDRISRYIYNWSRMAEYIEFPLDDPSDNDIVGLVGKVNRSLISKNGEWSPLKQSIGNR